MVKEHSQLDDMRAAIRGDWERARARGVELPRREPGAEVEAEPVAEAETEPEPAAIVPEPEPAPVAVEAPKPSLLARLFRR